MKPLKGCGGRPAALLTGDGWTVQDIAGAAPVSGSKVTLVLGQDGRVSGQTSCNNFTGRYTLSGEGLKIGPVASTRKACAPELMKQEQAFLAALGAIWRFDVGPDGRLTLFAGDSSRLVAARP